MYWNTFYCTFDAWKSCSIFYFIYKFLFPETKNSSYYNEFVFISLPVWSLHYFLSNFHLTAELNFIWIISCLQNLSYKITVQFFYVLHLYILQQKHLFLKITVIQTGYLNMLFSQNLIVYFVMSHWYNLILRFTYNWFLFSKCEVFSACQHAGYKILSLKHLKVFLWNSLLLFLIVFLNEKERQYCLII